MVYAIIREGRMAVGGIGSWLRYSKHRPVVFPYSQIYYLTDNQAKKRIRKKREKRICQLLDIYDMVLERTDGSIMGKDI